MLRRFNAIEAAEILGMEKHLLKPLREHGFLASTKVGRGYSYDSEELDEFIRMTRGYDLSGPTQIALAAQIIQPQKRPREVVRTPRGDR